MQDDKTPNKDVMPNTPPVFKPELPGDDNTLVTNPSEVELVGRRAEEKVAKPEAKKRSLFRRYFDTGIKKESETEPKPQPNVPEKFIMRWSAPEFVQTHKPAGWYLGFAGLFIVLIGLAIFTKQYITVGLFVVMGIAFLIYANRPPRVLQYQISNYGVYVGEKKYTFDNFDAYYETSDYGQTVLELVPNQRLGTLVSLPPAEHQLETLEATLGQMLPRVDNRETILDTLFRKLRF